VDGIPGWIFYGVWYWYTLIKLGKFKTWKFLDEIPFTKLCFLHFFSNGCIIISYF